MPSKFLILALTLGLIYFWAAEPSTPTTRLEDGSYAFTGYNIKPLQPFAITGRVLSRKDYTAGREAELSPMDLALGWGVMAQPETVQHFEVTQRNRWYFWSAKKLPVSRREVETHTANIHIIYANESAAQAAQKIDVDDMITLEGQLIEVVGEDGWRWRSSLSHSDTGNGSCELLLVTHVKTV